MASIRSILASAVSLQYVSGQSEVAMSPNHIEGGTVALTWKDCGDSTSHAKITDLSPKTLKIGRKTTITGTGVVDEDVEDGTFEAHLGLTAGLTLLDCSGDASQRKKCSFPLNTGSLAFDGLSFPLKAGKQDITMELQISRLIPSSLVKTTTNLVAVSNSGQKIFCINVFTGKASEENGNIPLSYEDCGDASTHAKITGLTPAFVVPGQKTKITGTGNLDVDISGATFRTKTTFTGGDLLSCSGDAGQKKKCGMGPFGSLTYDGLQFPVKKGQASISLDLALNGLIPASLASTETTVSASTKNGDKLFCIKVFSAPASVSVGSGCLDDGKFCAIGHPSQCKFYCCSSCMHAVPESAEWPKGWACGKGASMTNSSSVEANIMV
jgi:hypothetical protein